jgi:serine/threonine-protein kinase
MKMDDGHIYVFGLFILNPSESLLLFKGQPVTGLQDMVFDLLHIFVRKPLYLFNRDELMQALWGEGYFDKNENTLTKYISDLRDVLKECDPDVHKCVETRRKKGYRFMCHVKKYDVEGVSDEVESLCTKAIFNLRKYSKVGFEKAIGFFENAIKLNEHYAPAFAGLADAYIWYTVFCYNTLSAKQMLEKARANVVRALAIDPSLAAAHVVNGFINIFHDWNWEKADEDLRRAIQIDPGSAPAHLWLSLMAAARNDAAGAFREIDTALRYDRFSRLLNVAKGIVYFETRRFTEALSQFRETEEDTREFLVAAFDGAYFGEALIYTQQGHFDDAFEAAQKAYKYSGNILDQIAMCFISTVAQKREEAQTLLDELMEQVERRYVSPFHLATIFLARGDRVSACEWLVKACEERDPWILFLSSDVRFDALHSDDCFIRVLQRIKLPTPEP